MPAKRPKRSGGRKKLSKKTLAAERRKSKKYPLKLAESRLSSLYGYVKKRGGKLPK